MLAGFRNRLHVVRAGRLCVLQCGGVACGNDGITLVLCVCPRVPEYGRCGTRPSPITGKICPEGGACAPKLAGMTCLEAGAISVLADSPATPFAACVPRLMMQFCVADIDTDALGVFCVFPL